MNALQSAIANRTAATFEERCASLAALLDLANFSEDRYVRAQAVNYLQEVEGIAVITDAAPLLVLATSDGVRVQPTATNVPAAHAIPTGGNVIPFPRKPS